MRNLKIDKKDALEILHMEEGHFFEKKSLGIDGKGVQKIAIAFANADGGEFIIGVQDEKAEPNSEKRWEGAEKPKDYNGLLQALFEIQPTRATGDYVFLGGKISSTP